MTLSATTVVSLSAPGDFPFASRLLDIAIALDGSALYQAIRDVVCEAFASPMGCFAFVDDDGRLFVAETDRSPWEAIFGLSDTRCVQQDSCIVSLESAAEHLPEHLLASPVMAGERLFGVLYVANWAQAYRDADRQRLQSAAVFVAALLAGKLKHDRREQALNDTAKQLRQQGQILDQIHDSVIAMDLGGYVTNWNKGAERLFGYTAEEAIGRNILFIYADEDEDDPFFDLFMEKGGREMEVRRRKKSGEIFWASVSLSLMRDTNDQPMGLIGYVMDISERLRAEEELRLYGKIFENSTEAIIITDVNERIISVNNAFSEITGFNAEEVMGQTPRLFKSGRHDTRFYEQMWQEIMHHGRWQGELWSLRKNGEIFPKWTFISSVRNHKNELTHFFSVFSDITERKQAEQKIQRLAYYDALTELPNRVMLQSLMEQMLTVSRRNRQQGAILFVDLDRFKNINDSLGHAAGDELLREVAKRLRANLRTEDIVSRLSGDEFVIVLVNIARSDDAGLVAQKILSSLNQPIFLEGQEISISASIGISVYPWDGDNLDSLLKNADTAMYRAKDQGKGTYTFYAHEMNLSSRERLELETELRRALERRELVLYYQPQVDLQTGQIIGAEVLLRWLHPVRGMVSPAKFIPLAEETGLIVPIGEWIIEATCAQNRAWQESGLSIVRLAVNISARQFRPQLVQTVADALSRYDLHHQYLELEITESTMMHNIEKVIDTMAEINAIGVRMALDDFGTGYSSLSYLKRFPIDKLKIDQSFVRGIPTDSDDVAIANAIIGMAKSLNLRVIAEGVETREQLDFLREHGCDQLQGYYFSRPVAADQFALMLRDGKVLQ